MLSFVTFCRFFLIVSGHTVGRCRTLEPGRPDEVVRTCPQCSPTHFLAKLMYNLAVGKVAQKFVIAK
jgi:hypothetical protein